MSANIGVEHRFISSASYLDHKDDISNDLMITQD
jgi:hypothetical protein